MVTFIHLQICDFQIESMKYSNYELHSLELKSSHNFLNLHNYKFVDISTRPNDLG